MSPLRGSVQAKLLNRTQTPVCPESQRGKGNTRCLAEPGLESGPRLPVFSVLRGEAGTALGWWNFRHGGSQRGSHFPALPQPHPPGPSKLPEDPACL